MTFALVGSLLNVAQRDRFCRAASLSALRIRLCPRPEAVLHLREGTQKVQGRRGALGPIYQRCEARGRARSGWTDNRSVRLSYFACSQCAQHVAFGGRSNPTDASVISILMRNAGRCSCTQTRQLSTFSPLHTSWNISHHQPHARFCSEASVSTPTAWRCGGSTSKWS